MEGDESYRRKERVALVAIVVLASLAVASLLVAFSYYCYIRNKVSRRLKSKKSEFSGIFPLSLFIFYFLVGCQQCFGGKKKERFFLVLGRMRLFDCL